MLENKVFVVLHGVYDIRQVILHRESFGWKTMSFDNSHMYATRDTQLPNIDDLMKLEYQYEKAIEIVRTNNKKLQDKVFLDNWVFVLYYLLIIPIIVHTILKKFYKKRLDQALFVINEVYNKARTLLCE